MTAELHHPRRHRIWLIACVSLVGLSFVSRLPSLSRIPAPATDEAFFQLSAVRFLEGRSFTWPTHPDAPDNGRIWAFHGPIYSRLMVPIFGALGINHFAGRIPDWAGGHLAILLLMLWLWRLRLGPEAFCLGILWCGSYTYQHLLLGRPDGLAFLALAIALICLYQAIREASWKWAFAAGLAAGIAPGMSISALFHVPATALLLACLLPAERRWEPLGACLAGIAVGGLCSFVWWLPHPLASLRQFLWFAGLHHQTMAGRLATADMLLHRIGLRSWWLIGLIVFTLVGSLPVAVSQLRRGRRRLVEDPASLIVVLATGFAIAGLLAYLKSRLWLYTFIIIIPWMLLPGILLWRLEELGRWRRPVAVLAALVVLGWPICAFDNAMRLRETVVIADHFDPGPLCEALAASVPAGAEIVADRRYFIEYHQLGWRPEPLPIYERVNPRAVPSGAWLVLEQPRVDWLTLQAHPMLTGRTRIARLAGLPTDSGDSLCIYGPVGYVPDSASAQPTR